MRLKAFKVQMYRPILDSGWVDVDDITVIVGKNESGKTALLKALHKFNPFSPEPYTLDREWPRGRRKDRSPDAVVVQTRFDFEHWEADEIAKLTCCEKRPTSVEISTTYAGDYTYQFYPRNFATIEQVTEESIDSLSGELNSYDSVSSECKERVLHLWQQAKKTTLSITRGLVQSEDSHAQIEHYKTQVESFQSDYLHSTDLGDAAYAIVASSAFSKLFELADVAVARRRVEEMVSSWIPTFIYMDDHKPFQGSAYLGEIGERRDNDQLTDEDKTFLMILEMAGLDFDEESQRATESEVDREQRMLDMNDASLTLTELLADHWSQREYKVSLKADGQHVIAFVSDEIQSALVPLNERSKGFQWFFAFDTTFLYETHGTFRNAVILLDEPGLHLHAAAQRDLQVRLKEYAEGNQLIYTTHMPFMIDMERLDNIRVCIESKESGSTVSADPYAADEHARFPLQAALGLSISQSLFVGPYNLVVEGITDFWLLSAMASVLRSANRTSLDERIVITPSGGATKAAYVATMLQGQQLNVVVLLDSDPEGRRAAEGLIKKWITKDRQVLLLGKVLGHEEEATLEDLFSDAFYLHFVNEAYEGDVKGRPLTVEEVNANQQKQLVRRIDAVLGERGVGPNSEGLAFNKGRVAKLLLSELPKRNLSELPDEVIGCFERLFQSINEAMPGLKDAPIPRRGP